MGSTVTTFDVSFVPPPRNISPAANELASELAADYRADLISRALTLAEGEEIDADAVRKVFLSFREESTAIKLQRNLRILSGLAAITATAVLAFTYVVAHHFPQVFDGLVASIVLTVAAFSAVAAATLVVLELYSLKREASEELSRARSELFANLARLTDLVRKWSSNSAEIVTLADAIDWIYEDGVGLRAMSESALTAALAVTYDLQTRRPVSVSRVRSTSAGVQRVSRALSLRRLAAAQLWATPDNDPGEAISA